ncbi:MAG TPA: hypothetical protein VJI96_02395 [Candidatus Andersenbacteria bacterium]|nr:hypothetical protein [Candidatus Andersenbacteria bacterium]
MKQKLKLVDFGRYEFGEKITVEEHESMLNAWLLRNDVTITHITSSLIDKNNAVLVIVYVPNK